MKFGGREGSLFALCQSAESVANVSYSTSWQGFIYDSVYLAYSLLRIQSSTARFSDLKYIALGVLYHMTAT